MVHGKSSTREQPDDVEETISVFGGGGGIFGGGQKRVDQRFIEPGEGFDVIQTVGHTDSETRALGQVGGGMEIRLTPHIGWRKLLRRPSTKPQPK